MGKRRDAHRIFVRKSEGKRPLGRPRRRWRITMTIFLQELGLEGVDLVDLAHDKDRWRAVVLRVP